MYKRCTIVSLPKQDIYRPPGALPILASICEQNNCDYIIKDFNIWLHNNLEKDIWQQIDDNWETVDPTSAKGTTYYSIFLTKLEQYVDSILQDKPDLIAISVFTDLGAVPCIEMIRLINQKSQCDIVIGGTGIRARPACTNKQELCRALLEQQSIQYFIFGEAEISFQKLLNGEDCIPGINDYNAEQIQDLNQFPYPSYDKINLEDYSSNGTNELVITSSRGCVRACTYCDVAKYWPKFRYRDAEYIVNEIYHYYKTTGVSTLEFSDSLINGSLKQFRQMNKLLIERKKQDPTFVPSYKGQYICRPKNQVLEQDYAEMKQAGCDYIYVGVESFSDSVRNDMHKKFNNADLDFHLEMCGKYGIKNSLLMIVGYPTETDADHAINISAIEKYRKYAQANIISLIVWGYTTGILENTPLWEMQNDLAILPEFPHVNLGNSNWISKLNPTLGYVKRVERWVELVEKSNLLGYKQPRLGMYTTAMIGKLKLLSEAKLC